ncbi:septum formation family protein [Williamsia serinedens]|uniref:Septum formation n=1 Tax=Williamsia serinedens TaxID=391736 RepID=A0ABT1GXT5_9NOCA|nr:septum formation family protein [Williamsia serinedens]MCP2159793.1 Septum formation [Williamsia serinedens]
MSTENDDDETRPIPHDGEAGDQTPDEPTVDDADETDANDDHTQGQVPDDVAPATPAATPRGLGWLRSHPLRTVLGAVVLGALAAAAIVAAVGGFSDGGTIATSQIGDQERGPESNAFNRSTPGTCLTWPRDDPGRPTAIGCGGEHYFEVAGVVDASTITVAQFAAAQSTAAQSSATQSSAAPSATAPSSVASSAVRPTSTTPSSAGPSSSVAPTSPAFGDDAPWPTSAQFGALRAEFCPGQVNAYLQGRFDPDGRFSVGMLFPSKRQWDAGERTLRCGLQLTDSTGALVGFLGRVADQDQSLQWPAGTCIGIDLRTRQPTDPVSCAEQHAFEVTAVVGLGQRFGAAGSGRPWPDTATQNQFLEGTCPQLTDTYLGGRQKFTDTTLNVQWSTLTEASWNAGSRTVVCYVGLPDQGGFATLVGSAKGNLLINGRVPTPPPSEPPGRLNPTPVPLPQGISPNPTEVPAPIG